MVSLLLIFDCEQTNHKKTQIISYFQFNKYQIDNNKNKTVFTNNLALIGTITISELLNRLYYHHTNL